MFAVVVVTSIADLTVSDKLKGATVARVQAPLTKSKRIQVRTNQIGGWSTLIDRHHLC